ncbi:MAG: hypothetical protein AAF480_10590 [Actinomycetota bacterium]
MPARDLETLVMRAVEMTILGREDPRLLVANKRKPGGPRKVARLLAGLANAADGRQTLLLIGVRGTEVTGIEALPDADWWDDLEGAFPGAVPRFDWMAVDIDGARVLAIATRSTDELIPAKMHGEIVVPFFDRGGLHRTRPARLERTSPRDVLPTASILGGWIERSVIAESDVTAYQGQLELQLDAVTGVMPDKNCSATLLVASREGPIELDVQVHPSVDDVGVFRVDDGIHVLSTFRVRLFLAAAVRGGTDRSEPASVQLVVSLLLPGRAVPELRSLLLSPDPDHRGSWRL